MLGTPQKLFQRASALGLECSSDRQQHLIRPGDPTEPWYLTYLKGHWVLFVNGIPQIHFNYGEVMKFLDRFDRPQALPLAKNGRVR
ncbi:MAG TPA: hypothetical protein IGR64_11225 [Leptolyngbyaceae cyanobacterium M65_K2018_010]|nr:hypothetical protein [Leptolyngbyaceae cyanobacterium M65_K2018_010]